MRRSNFSRSLANENKNREKNEFSSRVGVNILEERDTLEFFREDPELVSLGFLRHLFLGGCLFLGGLFLSWHRESPLSIRRSGL
jgi:hypothetical protein